MRYLLTSLNTYIQAVVATALTQPVDVMKTRLQNAKPGEFSVSQPLSIYHTIQSSTHIIIITQSLTQCFWYTAKTGPLGFFKVLYSITTSWNAVVLGNVYIGIEFFLPINIRRVSFLLLFVWDHKLFLHSYF